MVIKDMQAVPSAPKATAKDTVRHQPVEPDVRTESNSTMYFKPIMKRDGCQRLGQLHSQTIFTPAEGGPCACLGELLQ